MEPCASRLCAIEKLDITVDTIILLNLINDAFERFEHLSKQSLASAVYVVLFGLRDHSANDERKLLSPLSERKRLPSRGSRLLLDASVKTA
jgi:hypothetical protein